MKKIWDEQQNNNVQADDNTKNLGTTSYDKANLH
jgi:hypothetical protein